MDAPILRRFRQRAFSLTELLIVIAVIVILLAILLPALGKVRERSRTATCLANLKSIGTAVHLYMSDNHDYSPMRGMDSSNAAPPGWGFRGYGPDDRVVWSDQVVLGQYAGSTNGDNSRPAYRYGAVRKRSVFICPSDAMHDGEHVSYGMGPNFPYVNPTDLFKNFWRSTKVKNPSAEMVVVDGGHYNLDPGGFKEPFLFYGTPDEVTDRNWGHADPNSYYNWARRHNGGGANIVFLDGSARFFADLKTAYDQREIHIQMLDEH
jgi:prepilin-type N-terminal cleavage/methylation domain-containing protein/prepilin-type processing-associated H-X9-DG protein